MTSMQLIDSSLENKNENQNQIFKNRQHGILQHFKLILTAKADSTSLVVFRKFKRLTSLVSAYRKVNQIMYRRTGKRFAR